MTRTLSSPGGGYQPSSNNYDGGSPGRRTSKGTLFAGARTGPARWVLALAIFAAVMGASLGLGGVLLGYGWIFQAAVVVGATLVLPAVMRRWPALSSYAPLGALAGWFMGLTLVFFPTTAIVGFIPTPGTFKAALDLAAESSIVIMSNLTPVPAVPPMVFLVCAGLGFTALLIDTVVITIGMPAAGALGLLLVMLPPAVTTKTGIGLLGFLGAAAGFLLILGCCRWYAPEGKLRTGATLYVSGTLARATALGAAVLLLMALVPVAIPGFNQGLFPQGSRLDSPGGGTRFDTMISLGNDLRAQSTAVSLRYLSNTENPQYLRLNTLEDFTGKSWGPSKLPAGLSPILTDLAQPASPGPDVPRTEVLTQMSIASLESNWLPAPLSAISVEGVTGRWLWNPSTQALQGRDSSTQGQNYLVRSVSPVLTQESLSAANGTPTDIDPIYMALPTDVPELVWSTAKQVAGSEPTLYGKAMALQDYLRSPAFSYSLNTPASEGYDGSGMAVLAEFLEKKSGYCVHFSAAMAVMAREVGIPSRIAVGYAPGGRTTATGELEGQKLLGYEATGLDAHAWPELFFEGLGWVPFEPTPSRGSVPSYAQDEAAPAPAPGGASAPSAQAQASTAPTQTASTAAAAPSPGSSASAPSQWLQTSGAIALILLLLAAPALARSYVRRRRVAQLLGATTVRPGMGSATGLRPEAVAWRELLATAVDYGYSHDPALTPALTAAGISHLVGKDAPPGLELLLHAYEQASYGQDSPGTPGTTPSGQELAAALDSVTARLRNTATPWARIRATLVPASFLERTL